MTMSLTDLRVGAVHDGVTIAPTFDRIMAYPELAVPAYRLLARYDRTRLLPGVDAIPPDSVTLLETNPRFVAAFLAGVNHEVNRELLWRRYPTDQRGTPVRRFWDRLGRPERHRRPPDAPVGGRPIARRRRRRRVQPGAADPRRAAAALPEHGGAGHPRQRPGLAEQRRDDGEAGDLRRLPRPRRRLLRLRPHRRRPAAAATAGSSRSRSRSPSPASASTSRDRPAGSPRGARPPGPTPGSPPPRRSPSRTCAQFAVANGLQPVPADGATVAEALFQNPVQVLVHARHLAFTEEA